MSLLTPVKTPVKIYRWDDVGAPVLDKTSGCMLAIFKACLVTGYGAKESAGWTMPFEDIAAGIKVFRPEINANADFYLQLSSDTGKGVTPKVYSSMTSASAGEFKLKCTYSYRYADINNTGKWLIIASSRTLWCFTDQYYAGSPTKTGSFFYCGDIRNLADTGDVIYLRHTGSEYENGNFQGLLGKDLDNGMNGVMYNPITNTVTAANPTSSLFDGETLYSDQPILSPIFITADSNVYRLLGVFTSATGVSNNNFNIIDGALEYTQKLIVFGTSGAKSTNFFFATEFWD